MWQVIGKEDKFFLKRKLNLKFNKRSLYFLYLTLYLSLYLTLYAIEINKIHNNSSIDDS